LTFIFFYFQVSFYAQRLKKGSQFARFRANECAGGKKQNVIALISQQHFLRSILSRCAGAYYHAFAYTAEHKEKG